MVSDYLELVRFGVKHPQFAWLAELAERATRHLETAPHGDLPRWRAALQQLPVSELHFAVRDDLPVLGAPVADSEALQNLLMSFHPWRKGPMEIGGLFIDTEWRSDWKWARVAPHLDLDGHRVLDIGCGNGYYGWRMLGQGARMVVGLDPTLVFVMQWLACRHFAGLLPNFVLPLGVEDLPAEAGGFDTVLSMGVLYHRKDPLDHLRRLKALSRAGGQVLLETLVLEEPGAETLVPEGRYARMRNVWAVPAVAAVEDWMAAAGLRDIRHLDTRRTTIEEQRSTGWMSFESLDRCLDPEDPGLTVEGYPAPVRAAFLARA